MQAITAQDFETAYQNLTNKQRAIIDAHAENPDAYNYEKARIAESKLDGDESINDSYCSQVINNKYPDIAEYRRRVEQGEDVRTAVPDGSAQATQVESQQPTREARISVESATDGGVEVTFEPDYLRELLASKELPAELHDALVNEVIELAFDG